METTITIAFLNLNNSGASNLLLGGNELQEVAVVSNGYTGQYGRQAGAQMDYTTKSGGNSFHGDAVYNWTGRELNGERSRVNKAFGGTRPFENNNQWAASIGGPIKQDKAYFFVNTEGIRYIFGSIHTPMAAPTSAFESLRAWQCSAGTRQPRRFIKTHSSCITQLRESPRQRRKPIAAWDSPPILGRPVERARRVGHSRCRAETRSGC